MAFYQSTPLDFEQFCNKSRFQTGHDLIDLSAEFMTATMTVTATKPVARKPHVATTTATTTITINKPSVVTGTIKKPVDAVKPRTVASGHWSQNDYKAYNHHEKQRAFDYLATQTVRKPLTVPGRYSSAPSHYEERLKSPPATIPRPVSSHSQPLHDQWKLASFFENPQTPVPPASGEFLLLTRLPFELRQQIYSYLIEGQIVLDSGWKRSDYLQSPELTSLDLPALYRVKSGFYDTQSTARIEPVCRHSNTGLMFTCKAAYDDYARHVYEHSRFVVSGTKSIHEWLLCRHRGTAKVRNESLEQKLDYVQLPSPSPIWIRQIHIHMYAYGATRFRSDAKYQAKYYLGWRRGIAAMAKNCVNLQEVHYTIDVPRRMPQKVDLRQDWAWALLPTADIPLKTCTVQLNMNWEPEMAWAFEGYLNAVLNRLGRATGIAAIRTAREEHMETEEGQLLRQQWDEFLKWNEDELLLMAECAKVCTVSSQRLGGKGRRT